MVVLFQINGVSYITAHIIKNIEKQNHSLVTDYFKVFLIFSVMFIILYTISKSLQNNLLSNLTQWIKQQMLSVILITNNENFSDTNFIEFITPITRISVSFYVIFTSLFTVVIPTFAFLMVVFFFLLYKNIAVI